MSKQAIANEYKKSQIVLNKGVAKQVTIELPNAHPKQLDLITAFDNNLKIRYIVGACGTKFELSHLINRLSYWWDSSIFGDRKNLWLFNCPCS